jgi:hypothetical protein
VPTIDRCLSVIDIAQRAYGENPGIKSYRGFWIEHAGGNVIKVQWNRTGSAAFEGGMSTLLPCEGAGGKGTIAMRH